MDDEETRHRRLRLGELVEACFGGEQKALRQHIAARTKKEPNQGEISWLLKLDNSARSFGDKKAKNLTDQIGLHRRWFDMPLGANLRREQWLSESVTSRAVAEDVAHLAFIHRALHYSAQAFTRPPCVGRPAALPACAVAAARRRSPTRGGVFFRSRCRLQTLG